MGTRPMVIKACSSRGWKVEGNDASTKVNPTHPPYARPRVLSKVHSPLKCLIELDENTASNPREHTLMHAIIWVKHSYHVDTCEVLWRSKSFATSRHESDWASNKLDLPKTRPCRDKSRCFRIVPMYMRSSTFLNVSTGVMESTSEGICLLLDPRKEDGPTSGADICFWKREGEKRVPDQNF
eukprot:scaffold370_cov349-Pavlova_lutheri.AAC.22